MRNGCEAFGVDEQRRTCSCRLWQLSGLPCAHAIAVIFKVNRFVEEYVPTCFRKKCFVDAYHQYLYPVGGMSFWPDTSELSRILPPITKKMPGRPRKKRIRAAHENKTTNRVSRTGVTMTCSNCQQKGHNKKGCQNPTVIVPPKPPSKKGRPRKTPTVEPSLIDEDEVLNTETFVAPQEIPFQDPLGAEHVEGSGHFGSDQANFGVGTSHGMGSSHVMGSTHKTKVKNTKKRGDLGITRIKCQLLGLVDWVGGLV